MATYLENVAPSGNHMFPLYHVIVVVLVISQFGFYDRILVLIVPVPSNCLFFIFNLSISSDIVSTRINAKRAPLPRIGRGNRFKDTDSTVAKRGSVF